MLTDSIIRRCVNSFSFLRPIGIARAGHPSVSGRMFAPAGYRQSGAKKGFMKKGIVKHNLNPILIISSMTI